MTASPTMALIANARMYAVAPGAIDAWKRMFRWLADETGLPLEIIDHAFPAKLSELWARNDLACAFLCGWPWIRLGRTHQILAAPVPDIVWPDAAESAGQAVYRTHFVVHRDAPFTRLEDTFGHRFAFTIEDSHSGYNAPRHHLLAYRTGAAPLYREIVGPLTTVRRMLEAIAEQRTDVGPLDSYGYALLCRHDPALTERTRVLASTPLVPMPALVASHGTAPDVVQRLRAALLTVGGRAELAPLRADLCLSGFAALDPRTYEIAETWAEAAERRGAAVIS